MRISHLHPLFIGIKVARRWTCNFPGNRRYLGIYFHNLVTNRGISISTFIFLGIQKKSHETCPHRSMGSWITERVSISTFLPTVEIYSHYNINVLIMQVSWITELGIDWVSDSGMHFLLKVNFVIYSFTLICSMFL